MGKSSTLKKLAKDKNLGICADIFLDSESSKEDIIKAGEIAMLLLTGGEKKDVLGDYRYKEYRRRVLKGNKALDPKFLPPSSGNQ